MKMVQRYPPCLPSKQWVSNSKSKEAGQGNSQGRASVQCPLLFSFLNQDHGWLGNFHPAFCINHGGRRKSRIKKPSWFGPESTWL